MASHHGERRDDPIVLRHSDWLPIALAFLFGVAIWAALFERARHDDALLIDASLAHQANIARVLQTALDQAIAQLRAREPQRWAAGCQDEESAAGCAAERLGLVAVLKAYEGIELGRSGEIILVARNGDEVVKLQDGIVVTPSNIRGTQRFQRAFADEAGVLIERVHDAHDRLYAHRRLTQVPLAVLVSRTRYEVLLDNKSAQRGYWLSGLVATLVLLGFSLFWLSIAQQRRRLVRDLINSQADNARLIRQLAEERESSYRLATHDKLTGLANRMLFAEIAERHIARARRQRKHFAVLYVDLDRFKPINDTYGHKVGDQLLIEVARRMETCVRETDVVARLGGDEFVLLLSDQFGNLGAERVALKLIERLGEPYVGLAPSELNISPSIGIAFYPEDGEDIETLLRQADTAMYQAKERGRATYAYADPALNRRNDLHSRIETLLPQALRDAELSLVFQPKVALADFRVTGLEALLRWRSPFLGEVSPADFITVAERSGAIHTLGEYVVDLACRQLAHWRAAGLPLLPVAVNVSPRQLRSRRLYEYFLAALDRYELPARLLEIEVTETGLVEADATMNELLEHLAAIGVGIAIDDFGTGFSGLSHLRRMPAHTLKIDRCFIRDIRNDINDAKIVSSTIALAHNLKLQVVAEGVELPEQVAHLKANGCDQAQGYLFSPPLPPQEIAALLRAGHCPPRRHEAAQAAAAVMACPVAP